MSYLYVVFTYTPVTMGTERNFCKGENSSFSSPPLPSLLFHSPPILFSTFPFFPLPSHVFTLDCPLCCKAAPLNPSRTNMQQCFRVELLAGLKVAASQQRGQARIIATRHVSPAQNIPKSHLWAYSASVKLLAGLKGAASQQRGQFVFAFIL